MIKISQDDIIRILEKKNEPLTSRELAEYIDIRIETIRRALKKLLEHKEIKCRKPTRKELVDKGYNKDELTHMNSRWRVFFLGK